MRASRTTRSRTFGSLVVTDRDVEVVALIAVCGYATTAQVERDCFSGSDAGRKRLRKLYNHGYLQAAISDSRAPTLWSATKHGLELIEDRNGGPVPGARTAGVVRLEGIRHHVAVTDTRIAVAAMRDRGMFDLLAWHGPRATATTQLFRGSHVVPDGLAQVQLKDSAGSVRWLAAEIDMGTESRSAALNVKLLAYRALLARVQNLELWLVDASPSASGLATTCARIGLGPNVRCLRLPDLIRRPIDPPPRTLVNVDWPLPPYYAGSTAGTAQCIQNVARVVPSPARTTARPVARTGEPWR